jgi:hypothetical protein
MDGEKEVATGKKNLFAAVGELADIAWLHLFLQN